MGNVTGVCETCMYQVLTSQRGLRIMALVNTTTRIPPAKLKPRVRRPQAIRKRMETILLALTQYPKIPPLAQILTSPNFNVMERHRDVLAVEEHTSMILGKTSDRFLSDRPIRAMTSPSHLIRAQRKPGRLITTAMV